MKASDTWGTHIHALIHNKRCVEYDRFWHRAQATLWSVMHYDSRWLEHVFSHMSTVWKGCILSKTISTEAQRKTRIKTKQNSSRTNRMLLTYNWWLMLYHVYYCACGVELHWIICEIKDKDTPNMCTWECLTRLIRCCLFFYDYIVEIRHSIFYDAWIAKAVLQDRIMPFWWKFESADLMACQTCTSKVN